MGNVSEELQELSIAKGGHSTAIYHPGYGQSLLSALFYCLNYVTKNQCKTQASSPSLSDGEGGTPQPLEPMAGVLPAQLAPRSPRSLSKPPLAFICGAPRSPLHLLSPRALGMQPTPVAAPTGTMVRHR